MYNCDFPMQEQTRWGEIEGDIRNQEDLYEEFVAIDQGEENVGKILTVDDNGLVTPAELGGGEQSTGLFKIVTANLDKGWFVNSGGARTLSENGANHRVVAISGTGYRPIAISGYNTGNANINAATMTLLNVIKSGDSYSVDLRYTLLANDTHWGAANNINIKLLAIKE